MPYSAACGGIAASLLVARTLNAITFYKCRGNSLICVEYASPNPCGFVPDRGQAGGETSLISSPHHKLKYCPAIATMANLHFRQLQTPLCSEWHLSTIETTLHQFKRVLEDRYERQSVLTRLYQALWETLHKDFEDLGEPGNKKAKTTSDEGELLRVIQASLQSLIAGARNDLAILASSQDSHGPSLRALHVLEEDDPKTACRTRAEGLVFQAYMERGFQLEAERLACRRSFEAAAALHDAARSLGDPGASECDPQGRLRTWEKALELCSAALNSKKPAAEETQYYEPDDVEDLSQDFSNLSLQDQDLILPTSPEEATRVLSEFRPSQNIPATLQAILSAKADPNITIRVGGGTPLHNVIAFARKAHVRDMRRQLLEAGATECDAMKDRWVTRCRADASDDAWVANFHREPTLVPDMTSESP